MPRPSRRRQRRDAAVAAALVVGRAAPAAGLRQRLEPVEVVVEAEVEIDALHLAVGDEVGPGPELVVDYKTTEPSSGSAAARTGCAQTLKARALSGNAGSLPAMPPTMRSGQRRR